MIGMGKGSPARRQNALLQPQTVRLDCSENSTTCMDEGSTWPLPNSWLWGLCSQDTRHLPWMLRMACTVTITRLQPAGRCNVARCSCVRGCSFYSHRKDRVATAVVEGGQIKRRLNLQQSLWHGAGHRADPGRNGFLRQARQFSRGGHLCLGHQVMWSVSQQTARLVWDRPPAAPG